MAITVVAWSLALASLLCTIAALTGRKAWYWPAAICMHAFSTLSGFSIGIFTVAIAFIQWALALGHSLGWLRRTWHSGLTAGLAAAIYVVLFAWNRRLLFITMRPFFWLLSTLFSHGREGTQWFFRSDSSPVR